MVNVDSVDQSRSHDDALSAEEAAALLGVSRRTLYAYVSRGLLASEPGPGPTRARRYPRADVLALRDRHERARRRDLAAHGSLHWGLPVLDSALTLIEDGRLRYRGRDAIELSRAASVEEVAALLWTGEPERARELFADLPASRPGSGAGPLATRLGAHLLRAGDRSLGTLAPAGAPALRQAALTLGGLLAAAGARGAGPLAERLARGWGGAPAGDLGAALILCADHELNVSAFTARAVASADAKLEWALLAALCALRGRRHGGMVASVERLVADAEREGARAAAERALAERGGLPGFGHPLYPDGDPRGAELLRRAVAAAPGRATAPVRELVGLAGDELGAAPTLDLGLVALARALRLPPEGAFGLFALGRATGWIAHALEAAAGPLIRPRSRYVGPPPADSATST
jgi:citrate synthase